MISQAERIRKVKRKYGENAFKKFGRMGGSPVLKAWKQGKIPKSLVKSKK